MTKMAAASADVPVIAFKGDGPVYAHRNPHPRHVYELIIQTDEAPGAFNGSYASISMTAKSSACAQVHGFPIGAASIPSAFVEFHLKKYPILSIVDILQRTSWSMSPIGLGSLRVNGILWRSASV